MNETEESLYDRAQRLRDSFSSQSHSFPYQLANTLCIAVAEDRIKDAMLLYSIMRDFLIEKNLTYLLQPTAEVPASNEGKHFIQGSLFQ